LLNEHFFVNLSITTNYYGGGIVAQKSFNHLSEETQGRINAAIAASNLTDKEWIDRATEVWVMHELKNEIPDFRKEIEEVEGLTNRIRGVLVNLAQRTAFEKDETRREWEDKLAEHRLLVEQMSAELLENDRELKAANEETQRQRELREEADRYAKQVEQSSESNRALAESYKEKNGTLTDLVAQYKAGYDESQTLRDHLSESRRAITSFEKELADEREKVKREAQSIEERLRLLEERHKSELERVVERTTVEHERESLRIRTEFQEQLQKAREESTVEIRGLYERMERLRVEHEQMITAMRNEHQRQIDAQRKQDKSDK
jgi:hypothetical protein